MINFLSQLSFGSPWFLLLLIIPLLLILWHLFKVKEKAFSPISWSGFEGFSTKMPIRGILKQYGWVLRALALTFAVIALARPQRTFTEEKIENEGIDIVICMDLSNSMKAMDFKPNRLEAAKRKAIEFIEGRSQDRIGLVVFASESYTYTPLTSDHPLLIEMLSELRLGLMEGMTAIGEGLATSVNALRDSEANSKVVILLTDGENTKTDLVDPRTAARTAKEFNVRTYTIGVGSEGFARTPLQTTTGELIRPVKVKIDEELLKEIAKSTGGKYFRATSNAALGNIYTEIDELEKTKIEVTQIARKTEEFHPFLWIALALLAAEMLLRYGVVENP
ncbi:MAG: VWA domain-containing protein [Bacteroidia bacterium]